MTDRARPNEPRVARDSARARNRSGNSSGSPARPPAHRISRRLQRAARRNPEQPLSPAGVLAIGRCPRATRVGPYLECHYRHNNLPAAAGRAFTKRAGVATFSDIPRDDGGLFPLIRVMETITRELWLKARAGDREAYDRLFGLHADRALLYIRARLGPRLREKVESMDVLQEAYLAAHRDFDRFEYADDGAFTRWLCRIIDNRIRDLGDHFGALKRQPVEPPRSDPTGVITALDRAEHRAKVARGLDALSDDHRQVLLLRFFEGLSAEEVGQRMGRSAGAVRKLTARALEELGKVL